MKLLRLTKERIALVVWCLVLMHFSQTLLSSSKQKSTVEVLTRGDVDAGGSQDIKTLPGESDLNWPPSANNDQLDRIPSNEQLDGIPIRNGPLDINGQRDKLPTSEMRNYHKMLLNCTGAHAGSDDELRYMRERTKQLLAPQKFKFLGNYKNPCWRETHNSPDLNLFKNGFVNAFDERLSDEMIETLKGLQQLWKMTYERGGRERVRCLPYFYLAGVTKCGTSDMWSEFRVHPNITTGFRLKETQWWNRRALGYRSTLSKALPIDDYIGLYDGAAKEIELTTSGDYHHLVTGEGTPSTLWSVNRWPLLPGNENSLEPQTLVPHLIHSLTPGAKIVITLRDPINRLYSHYFHNLGLQRKMGSEETFHQLVETDVARLQSCLKSRTIRECVYDGCINGDLGVNKLPVQVGMYSVFLKDWLSVFPRDQVMIVRFEDYIVDRLTVLNKIFRFLGVGNIPESLEQTMLERSIKNKKNSQFKAVGPMWNKTREILADFYRPFSAETAQLLGDDNFLWQ